MGWRFVKQPNGLLARFSETVDDFTHYDLSFDEAVYIAQGDVGRGDALAKVERGRLDGGSADPQGLFRFRECIERIRSVHGNAKARRREKQLSKPVAAERTKEAAL